MGDEKKPEEKKSLIHGWVKGGLGGVLGLGSGVIGVYATALVDRVAKPPIPVANFAVAADGLTVTCQNQASGESGWWDFGDGSPLEAFDSAAPNVAHTYGKPGNYGVKLTVRNFLMQENDRTVPVDLSAAAPAALPPAVTGLQVVAVGGPRPVAPAAFRVRGEVKNTDRALLDLGDKVEVLTETGPFERLVVFEKPGQFAVQLTGLNGKQAAKLAQSVFVAPPAAGSMSVVLRVTDTAPRAERNVDLTSVVLTPPAKGGATKLEKAIRARNGKPITAVKIGHVKSAAVKNLTATVAADGQSATLTGEWTAVGDDAAKAAGGSQVIVPLEIVHERSVAHQAPTDSVSEVMAFNMAGTALSATLTPAPRPVGVAGATRKTAIELRQAAADGQSIVLVGDADVKLPWSKPVTIGPKTYLVKAEAVGDQVQVTMTAGK